MTHPPDRTRTYNGLANLFNLFKVPIIQPCQKCGRPFLIDRPPFDPDQSKLCLGCRQNPRPDDHDIGSKCDCGDPAVIIIKQYGHDASGRPATLPQPLCLSCALLEIGIILEYLIQKGELPS